MFKLWLRYYIYDMFIDVLFGELLKNFQTPSMDLLYLYDTFEELKSNGVIDDFRLDTDYDGKFLFEIDAPLDVQIHIMDFLGDILDYD